MTKEELLDNGFHPFNAKIGILYIKEPFFGFLNNEGVLDYRYKGDDTHSLGKATTLKELNNLEKEYYIREKEKLQMKLLLIDQILKTYDN